MTIEHRLEPAERTSRSFASSSLSVHVLGLVVLAGTLCLPRPFGFDQALFAVFGRQLTRGAVLYRDIFDIKQPGIFVFYAAGGSLFGFTEVGIHAFELAYWIAFSVFSSLALRAYFTTDWAARFVPALTVVVYYLYATVDLTQIEVVVAFPILLAWWLIDRAEPGTRAGLKRFAGAGIAAAVVVSFKNVYVVIVLGFLVYALVRSWRRRASRREIGRAVAVFLVAMLLPLLAAVAYFAAFGQLERIWWAYFEIAPKNQLTGKALTDLKWGGRRFMIGHAPILMLASIAVLDSLSRRRRPGLDLTAGMLIWLGLGALAFYVQDWWEYKWVLFTVPLGVLATVGLETLATLAAWARYRFGWTVVPAAIALAVLSASAGASSQHVQTLLLLSVPVAVVAVGWATIFVRHERVPATVVHLVVAGLAVSAGVAAIVPAQKVRGLIEHRAALTVEDRSAYRWALNADYRAADMDLAVVRSAGFLRGPIHVLDDAVLLLRADRPPATPFLVGYDGRSAAELEHDLRAAPPPYIVVNGEVAPAVRQLIRSEYIIDFVGAAGTWFVLTSRISAPG